MAARIATDVQLIGLLGDYIIKRHSESTMALSLVMMKEVYLLLKAQTAEQYQCYSIGMDQLIHLLEATSKGETREEMDVVVQTREDCPACRTPIPFNSPLKGICPNGHAWGECPFSSENHSVEMLSNLIVDKERCLATFKIIAASPARSCLGCNRKILHRMWNRL